MSPETIIIEKLFEANKNDNLAIFAGAGVSKSSDIKGTEMPTWDNLIENIKNKINEKNETDFLKIAQYFYNVVGEDEYYNTLENMIPVSFLPSKVHKRIFDINPHVIITTNWDTILESANQEYTQFYDIVCNDKELVDSVFHHRIIKMHGDFSHRNIVFKEDDYLNYENNFPLISNYIKSILSTHTVLFLGYSYNDINLKLIIQWLRNNADHRPDMFLTAFNSSSNQIEYLKNHGIETIILSDINNKLDGINDLNIYSRMTYTFLDKIYKGYNLIDFKKPDNVVRYIFKKIKPLDSLNVILLDQIQKLLTNCNYIFDNDCTAILQFNNIKLTGDYNREIRDIHVQFVELLNNTVKGEKPSPVLLETFPIFVKAGIKGIMLEKNDWADTKQTFIDFRMVLSQEIDILKSSIFDFNFFNHSLVTEDVDILFENAFKLYNLNKIEASYNLMEKIINITASANDHIKLFISLFNRNILLKRLKFDPEYKEKYAGIEECNIESRYNNLTSQLKLTVDPVYDFLNFSEIYKYLHLSIYELDQIRRHKQSIDSGGFVYSDNIYRYSGQHINLINFVISNKIMVENFSEFKKINSNFVEIALLRQTQKEETIFTRPEVYACIRYFNIDELRLLLIEFYTEESKKTGTFKLEKCNKDWLINTVLKNCIDQYLIDEDILYSPFPSYIDKIIFILSIIELSDDDYNNIFSLLNGLISGKFNTIMLFQSINLFLGLQYRIFKKKIDKNIFISLLETLMNKIIDEKIGGYELLALTENYLSNLYGYASVAGVIFDNNDIVEKLLTNISEFESETKLELIQNFVLNIYQISSDSLKDIIKNYILSFTVDDKLPVYRRISYNNSLVILKIIEFSPEILNEIRTFIEPYTKENIFDSYLYLLNSQIEYMFTKMNIKELEDISVKIKEAIKKYQGTENRSIF
jgi:hypothetical protein